MDPSKSDIRAIGRGRGPWCDQTSVIELRRPQNVSSSPVVAVNSKLSAEAKEFIPKGMSVTYGCTSADSSQLSDAGNFTEDASDCTSDQLWIVQQLKEVIDILIKDPGKFDLLVDLVDLMELFFADEEALGNICVVIIDHAVSNPSFRYNGARFCSLLNKCQSQAQNSTFRRILLNKLCEEHARIEYNLEKSPERAYGFVRFLAEVYMQLELSPAISSKQNFQRIGVIGDSLFEALNLIIQVPYPENLKPICDVLKLAGKILDDNHPDNMQEFLQRLQELISDARTGSAAKNMIKNILQLRKENWGFGPSSEDRGNPVLSDSNSHEWSQDGIYYGPDHQVLSAEEYEFLIDSCKQCETTSECDDSTVWDPEIDDTANAEISAAFQEFRHKTNS